MVVNIYLFDNKFLYSQVDETTSHLLGNLIDYDNRKYVVVRIEEREHIDYNTIVRINELVLNSDKICEVV